MVSKYRYRPNAAAVKPAILGIVISVIVTMLLVAVFALLFVIIKKIAESAIVPIALVSAVVGCFAGAYICAVRVRGGAVVYGIAIGLAMFMLIWLIGAFCSESIFGSETIIRFFVLIGAGAAGGYVGRRYKAKK